MSGSILEDSAAWIATISGLCGLEAPHGPSETCELLARSPISLFGFRFHPRGLIAQSSRVQGAEAIASGPQERPDLHGR